MFETIITALALLAALGVLSAAARIVVIAARRGRIDFGTASVRGLAVGGALGLAALCSLGAPFGGIG